MSATAIEAWEWESLRERVAEFILETDPFGDHFSRREIGLLEKGDLQKLSPQQESGLLSGDEQINTIREMLALFNDQGAMIGSAEDVGSAINRAYEVLSHAALLHPEQEAIAKLLWHRFGDSSVEEWEDETHKTEFLEAADDLLFRARSRQGATLLPGEMQSAIRAWLQCSIDKRPSAAALGQRIAEIASTISSQPFFLTQWEREDYERRQRGEPELGPGGTAVSPAERGSPQ